MSILKNRIAAGILSACVMLGCVGYGWSQRPASMPDTEYGNWVVDTAGVLDQSTIELVNDYNEKWDDDYSSVMALAVVPSTKGWEMQEYAQKVGEDWGLGQNDMLVLVDTEAWDYYFIYSYQILNILDFNDVYDTFYSSDFENAFYYKRNVNDAVTSVYENMDTVYTDGFEAYNSTGDGYISHYDYGFGDGESNSNDVSDYVAQGIAWGAIIWAIVAAIDRRRYKKWYRQHGYYGKPTTSFVPLLFWHGTGSKWNDRMYRKMGGDRSRTTTSTSYTSQNTGNYRPGTTTGYTNYRTGGSGTTFSGSNYRSSGSSSSSRGGSFGGSGFGGSSSYKSSSSGSRSSSSYSSSSRSSSSYSSSRSSSSSSSSRGGSFGGGGFGGSSSRSSSSSSSRGGSFGGSRGGGFGGRR